MPLPDATKDKRIYQLLKNIDLGNLTFSEFQTAAQSVFAEPEAEDTLRRIVLVNTARMAVAGDWNGLTSAGGGSGTTVSLINTTLDSGGTPCDTYTVTTQPPFGANSVSTSGNKYTTVFTPFIAPKSGDVSEVARENSNAVTAEQVYDFIGIYSTNSTDYTPQTLLGYGTFDSSTAAIQYDTSLSATVTLVEGTVYWLGFTSDSVLYNCQYKMLNYFYRSPVWPDTDLMVTNGGSAYLSTTGNETALASSYTASDLTAGSVGAAMPHVSLVIG